jgi:tetratricopeptide (TPR) repeat protein
MFAFAHAGIGVGSCILQGRPDRECFGTEGVHVAENMCRIGPGASRASNMQSETCMKKFSIRLLVLAVFAIATVVSPLAPAYAAGDDNPAPPAKGKKKDDKSSSIDSPKFLAGYRTAYDTIYDRHDYTAAIAQLKALDHDDRASVANLIGYSYRKLGDYKLSQVWYERALQADPNHVKTWQYYGLWQLEQGNRDQAQYHLNKIAQLAGTGSAEYRSLAAAMEMPPGTGLVY